MSNHIANELTRLNYQLQLCRDELSDKREERAACSTARDEDGCYLDDSYAEADDRVTEIEFEISEIEEKIEALV